MDFDTKIQWSYADTDNSQIVVNINGDMETFYTKFFMTDMTALMDTEKAVKIIYMDFDCVNYVSSSFIACMLQVIHKAKLGDMEVFFLNLNTSMRRIIDTMGLAHFVKEIDVKKRKGFAITCKKCRKSIIVNVTGEFECPHCGAVMNISKRGVVK